MFVVVSSLLRGCLYELDIYSSEKTRRWPRSLILQRIGVYVKRIDRRTDGRAGGRLVCVPYCVSVKDYKRKSEDLIAGTFLLQLPLQKGQTVSGITVQPGALCN